MRAAGAPRREEVRRGAAMVELALILPLLLFLFLAGMDYSRVFYASVIVTNCARNAALYASDPNIAGRSAYETIAEAACADAVDLDVALLEVTSTEGRDAAGYGWAEVTVTYPFQTIAKYPGIPSQIAISRSVRMRKVGSSDLSQ